MNRGIFPIAWAQMNRQRAGEKYRPSNGTEGEVFMANWCRQCVHDQEAREACEGNHLDGSQYCPILTKTMLNLVDEEGYPSEWQYGVDGQPCCTAFAFDAVLPDPRCSRTLDLFGASL